MFLIEWLRERHSGSDGTDSTIYSMDGHSCSFPGGEPVEKFLKGLKTTLALPKFIHRPIVKLTSNNRFCWLIAFEKHDISRLSGIPSGNTGMESIISSMDGQCSAASLPQQKVFYLSTQDRIAFKNKTEAWQVVVARILLNRASRQTAWVRSHVLPLKEAGACVSCVCIHCSRSPIIHRTLASRVTDRNPKLVERYTTDLVTAPALH